MFAQQLDVTPVEAAEELLRRRAARAKVIDFTEYTYPSYQREPAHELMADMLDKVIAGDIKRLMIFAPPQHGKSRLAIEAAAMWLGKRPDDPVAYASYGADLAISHSREVRDVVESPEYRALFGDLSFKEVPVKTRDDSRAVNYWQLQAPHRGAFWAGGVNGPITGRGFLLGIIDDPFKDWADAQSPTSRQKVWDWWRGTFRHRIREGGAIVIIMTRWHEDDLCGRILAEQGDEWTVLRLPAEAETQEVRDQNNRFLYLPVGLPDPLGRKPGEPLAPLRFSREALEEFKRDLGSVVWGALYQGVPRPLEGSRFKREWFSHFVDAVPKEAKRVRYWDKAGTEDGGAFTAGVLVAVHRGLVYIEDVVKGQWSAMEREDIIRQTAELDAQKYGRSGVKIWLEQEPGSGGKESAEATIRRLAGFSVRKETVTGDKDVRLEPFAAQAEAGNLRLKRARWNQEYIEEFVALPNGTYRDQSDATAGAFNKLHIVKRSVKKGQIKGLWQGPKNTRRAG